MGTLRVVSQSGEPFVDRREAGRLLARELGHLKGSNAVVLGIPRGGVLVAREIASALEADLDVVLARKMRTPGQPELALGSVAEDGRIFLNDQVVKAFGVSKAYIEAEGTFQAKEIARRAEVIRRIRKKVPLTGRTVIVTDDGIATGATTQAAFWAVAQESPRTLIAAIPVGPEETVTRLAEDVDEMICLKTPPYFSAVGQFYVRFDQTDDDDVISVLREHEMRKLQA